MVDRQMGGDGMDNTTLQLLLILLIILAVSNRKK